MSEWVDKPNEPGWWWFRRDMRYKPKPRRVEYYKGRGLAILDNYKVIVPASSEYGKWQKVEPPK